MGLVLDCSITLAWILPGETAEAIQRVRDFVSEGGAWVPSLWRLEVANVLEVGVRRGRHDADFRDRTLADLALLPIQTDAETSQQAWNATLRLAQRYRLTVYDAAYLELALRRSLPLATLDLELRSATLAAGAQLLPA